ncbi:MAG: FAD-dependent thymidylate synthase [Nitrososphaerota archaeon]|nr:FAD-dependent thymidylate synthase [Nitrososphaerota archaeon]
MIILKVTLLAYTPNPEKVIAAAARQCHSKLSALEIANKIKREDIEKTINKVIEVGHFSVLEHAYFTFLIEGISRACSHQLVRHRIASYSQQSQRFVEVEDEFIVPKSISENNEAHKIFSEALDNCKKCYKRLIEMGIPMEDARYIIPQASPTKIVVTMNARSLWNFFELRCCLTSQWEIRMLAEKMLELVKSIAPIVFKKAGPFCITRGICPEKKYDCPKWIELYKTK